jgi:hypothetical protein
MWKINLLAAQKDELQETLRTRARDSYLHSIRIVDDMPDAPLLTQLGNLDDPARPPESVSASCTASSDCSSFENLPDSVPKLREQMWSSSRRRSLLLRSSPVSRSQSGTFNYNRTRYRNRVRLFAKPVAMFGDDGGDPLLVVGTPQ